MRKLFLAMSVATACLCAPAVAHAQDPLTAPESISENSSIPDPWEGFNRNMYAVNDAADHAVLEPVARGYRRVTPGFVRSGVNNFLHNLGSPVTFVNDLLQGQVKRAGVTVARLGINSTLGVFGLLDPATDFGLERHEEDFGQTLAVWGVGSGPYVFLPLMGPTSVRDGAGQIVDLAFDPLNWARFHHDNDVRVTRAVVGGIAAREELLDPIDSVRRTSIDPYATIRATYQLTRESEIRNGLSDDEELPNLDGSSEPTAPDQTAPSVETAPVTPPAGANTTKAQHHFTLDSAKTPKPTPKSKPNTKTTAGD
ncbi:MAG: VacJ family lipoprotein [Terricaulis sp.]